MSSFEDSLIEKQPISQGLLRVVRLIGEFRGKEELYREQSPQVLDTIRQAALIQSTESSNRIEGVSAPHQRILDMVRKNSPPRNRPEQEIAGYRDVLNTIHASATNIPFTTGVVLQLHRDLYAFSGASFAGQWKQTDNSIEETLPDGSRHVRFKPVPAFRTADSMERLHESFNKAWMDGQVEHLLLIPTYVLDFLCIHPFHDGNGRMARLLALVLLYHAGYEVGRFISLERVIEDTKESYYDTLWDASQGWHEGQHRLTQWWDYFLGVVVLKAYREFEHRVGAVTSSRGAKGALVVDVIHRLPATFRITDIERACPGVSRATITRILQRLKDEGKVACVKGGRDAVWERAL